MEPRLPRCKYQFRSGSVLLPLAPGAARLAGDWPTRRTVCPAKREGHYTSNIENAKQRCIPRKRVSALHSVQCTLHQDRNRHMNWFPRLINIRTLAIILALACVYLAAWEATMKCAVPEHVWPHANHRFQGVVGAIVLIWLGGSLLLFVRMMRGLYWVLLLKVDGQPLDDDRYATVLARVRHRIGVSHLPTISISRRAPMPLATGFWRSRVLIPVDLLSVLSESELKDVLVHECAHCVRGDLVVGVLQRLVAVLYWPHPLVHCLNLRLSRAREEVCDNYALCGSDNWRRTASKPLLRQGFWRFLVSSSLPADDSERRPKPRAAELMSQFARLHSGTHSLLGVEI